MTSFLAACRLLLYIPVLGCVVVAAGVFIMGMGRVLRAAYDLLSSPEVTALAGKKLAVAVIEIIYLFLVGTVAYITAIGLYKLFISDGEIRLPVRLAINTLKDLENKIIGVIVAALAVAFLGHAAGPDEPDKLLSYGAGIALVVTSLAVFVRFSGGPKGDGGG